MKRFQMIFFFSGANVADSFRHVSGRDRRVQRKRCRNELSDCFFPFREGTFLIGGVGWGFRGEGH